MGRKARIRRKEKRGMARLNLRIGGMAGILLELGI